MSVQAMAWAIDQQDVRDATARHVLLALANYADNAGKSAFPSTAKLERDTGLSESTIRRKLDSLEQMGLIKKGNQAVVAAYIERGDRRPVCYDMVMEKRGVTVTGGDERGVTVTPNPSLTINKPSVNRSRAKKPMEIVDDEFDEAWRLYPKRDGGNSKAAARKAWDARRREGVSAASMISGVKLYAKQVSTGASAITGAMLGGCIVWICQAFKVAPPPAEVPGTMGAIMLTAAHYAINLIKASNTPKQ
jgi:DNA-binding transcriptional ArsR family regulator